MEGGGLPWENKFQNANRQFIGAFCFMTMNSLPRQLEEVGPVGELAETKNEREAFVNRCTYHETSKTYESVAKSFPYKHHQLAKWMLEKWTKKDEKPADEERI